MGNRLVVIRDFCAYFESDTTYEVRVYYVATGKLLTTFIRGEFENSEEATNSGVRACSICSGQFGGDSHLRKTAGQKR